ncbi:MAG: dihydrofolate reductase [Lewinella sp.]|nr:dihydrofolate reductase [Lewinella sp.]
MLISAIVAVAQNGVIGDGDDIPWRLSSDLKYFKRTTIQHHVIMGRKTFASMGRPLPKRTNIVLTRNPFFVGSGILVARSLEEALAIAQDHGEEEAFVIGGGEIYRLAMPFLDKIYLTRVHAEPEGEVTFPTFSDDEWRLISQETHPADEKNDHDYTFEVYERRRKEEE